jgi:hypothetical protein
MQPIWRVTIGLALTTAVADRPATAEPDHPGRRTNL